MKSILAGAATGGLVGAISIHMGLSSILMFTCVICASILVAMFINE